MTEHQQGLDGRTDRQRLCLLVAVVRGLAQVWADHAVIVRDEDPRASAVLANASAELIRMVERYYLDWEQGAGQNMPRRLSTTVEDAGADPSEAWQVDMLMEDAMSDE